MFCVHTTLEEFENAVITGHFGFVFEEDSGRKYRNVIVFENNNNNNFDNHNFENNNKL